MPAVQIIYTNWKYTHAETLAMLTSQLYLLMYLEVVVMATWDFSNHAGCHCLLYRLTNFVFETKPFQAKWTSFLFCKAVLTLLKNETS